MKLYLDTNIILGWFKRVMQSKSREDEFVMEFLSSEERGLELVVSNLTKTEIYRYLYSEWGMPAQNSREIWETFMQSFNIEYAEAMIPSESINNLSLLCLKTNTKKNTLTNLMHLEIARNYGFAFLTGEKDLKERYATHYENILTYTDLRQKLS